MELNKRLSIVSLTFVVSAITIGHLTVERLHGGQECDYKIESKHVGPVHIKNQTGGDDVVSGYISEDKEMSGSNIHSHSRKNYKEKRSRCMKITWFMPPSYVTNRPKAMYSGFEGCLFSNCYMSYLMEDAAYSDAVIFTGRRILPKLPFTRPNGQIWIFSEHEPPYRYYEITNIWNQRNTFNWTMTYDRSVSDIHLPYGKITNRTEKDTITFDDIMQHKNKTALIIMSHCDTPSNRLKYVKELSQYIEVDVLGICGVNWECGERFLHDDCFKIINTYKFYLAFENSFCNNYFTEKVFDNFDYDSVLVLRGGKIGQSKQLLPEGTFISTDDFNSARDLGIYLRTMSDETYLNILKRKKQYTSLDGYTLVFQNAMCNICERMNNVNKFKNVIKDMNVWAYNSNPCVAPNDL